MSIIGPPAIPTTILCFSHLRWDFVFQRPQHILTRLADQCAIYYIEEPKFNDGLSNPYFEITTENNITVMTPRLSSGSLDIVADLKNLLDKWLFASNIKAYISWYYTPMALGYTEHLIPEITVYDCMDELSAFKFAPAGMLEREKQLLGKADIVFTGGRSLYNAKKERHENIHLFPSSIDQSHFSKAKTIRETIIDQKGIPSPILGFFGVIDERFDIALISEVATRRPDWQIVLIGPVVKIEESSLPRNSNIHYLGSKKYEDLPRYLADWDIAMIPFALNDSTRFISPTKTPEYLAAGIPVISTPIADVVDPYGKENMVMIVKNGEEFIKAAEQLLNSGTDLVWEKKVTEYLSGNSWDLTVSKMLEKLEAIKSDIAK
jgi:UDP-galactopyranose mutase